MTAVNRAALLAKTHKVLKKHYKPVPIDGKRTLLEHFLFACCLENSPPEAAEKVYASLKDKFFDLNEVRVSSVRELAEAMASLPDPEAAAMRLKGVLQSVFESQYSFDLEPLKKQNIGQAVKRLEKYEGASHFAVGYVIQAALGGHQIPVNQGAFEALTIVGVISPEEAAEHRVPGMERAIPKNKGVEFGSLLHQFGAAYLSSPFSPNIRKVLLEIAPDCKDRMPKRGVKKEEPAPEPAPPAPPEVPAGKKGAAAKPGDKTAPEKGAAKPAAGKPEAEKPAGKPAEPAKGDKGAEKGAAKPAGDKIDKRPAAAPPAAKDAGKKPAAAKPEKKPEVKPAASAKKSPDKKGEKKPPTASKAKPPAKQASGERKSATKRLAKRKPR